jgi:hypothetical protein
MTCSMCAFGYHDKCETPNECRNPNSIYRCPVCSKKYGKKEAKRELNKNV